MNSYTVEGIVIKRFNLGEADRLITLFTKNHGKITALAKGIRKPASKRAGSIEVFNHVKVSLIKSRGDLEVLTEVQIINSFTSWRNHLGRITLAYQICEIVDKLTPDHQPNPEVFEILKNSMSQIGSLQVDWKTKSENWSIDVVRELGFWSNEKKFDGDVSKYIEEIISRPLHSSKMLNKLK